MFVVNSTDAVTEGTALASALSAFGMVGELSLAVIPAGQTIEVMVPCSATSSVALGANCSSLTSAGGGGAASSPSSSSLSTGAIVGIAVGAAVGLALLTCTMIALLCRSQRKSNIDSRSAQQDISPQSPTTTTVLYDRYYLHHSPTPPAALTAPTPPAQLRDASIRSGIAAVEEVSTISALQPQTPITPVQPQPQHVSVSVGVQADELEVDECAARLEAEATSHYDDELRRAQVHLSGM